MSKTERICIIPARGGSKRIPRKNIKPFLGLPMVAYPIRIALESRLFDEVMVSTDDPEIAATAVEFGAKVPFFRGPEHSGDFSGTIQVVAEVLNQYQAEQHRVFDHGCCIFPTSPLLPVERLHEGLERLNADVDLDYVVGVLPFPAPVQRAMFQEGGRLHMFQPEHYATRSQDLTPSFRDAGQGYWFRSKAIFDQRPVLGPGAAPLVLSEMEAQDIDNEDDWRIAEVKYSIRHPKSS
jgi:N-acylneuraminate cytidylyltransferase